MERIEPTQLERKLLELPPNADPQKPYLLFENNNWVAEPLISVPELVKKNKLATRSWQNAFSHKTHVKHLKFLNSDFLTTEELQHLFVLERAVFVRPGRFNVMFFYKGGFYAQREVLSLRKDKLLPDHLYENKMSLSQQIEERNIKMGKGSERVFGSIIVDTNALYSRCIEADFGDLSRYKKMLN